MGGGCGMQANSETVSSRYCAYLYKTLSICVAVRNIWWSSTTEDNSGDQEQRRHSTEGRLPPRGQIRISIFSENQTFKSTVFLEKK